jgi:hypothetical protein
MSKSKNKNFSSRRDWYDDDEEDGYSYQDTKQKRKEKRMKNLIRSKNVDQIMGMDDDEYEDYRR